MCVGRGVSAARRKPQSQRHALAQHLAGLHGASCSNMRRSFGNCFKVARAKEADNEVARAQAAKACGRAGRHAGDKGEGCGSGLGQPQCPR